MGSRGDRGGWKDSGEGMARMGITSMDPEVVEIWVVRPLSSLLAPAFEEVTEKVSDNLLLDVSMCNTIPSSQRNVLAVVI